MSAAGHLPAFPYSTPPTHRDGLGLTKRELFAGMAMQGMLANPNRTEHDSCSAIAFASGLAADALIAELAKDKS